MYLTRWLHEEYRATPFLNTQARAWSSGVLTAGSKTVVNPLVGPRSRVRQVYDK